MGRSDGRWKTATVLQAENLALAIHDAVIRDVSRDDVAVLTVAHVERALTAERLLHWSFDSRDAMRHVTCARSSSPSSSEERSTAARRDAEIVFAELLGNVVRYAPK